MNVVLWILTVVLAFVFLAAGGLKLSRSKEQLAESGLAWTEDFSSGTVKLIGALELLAVLGLILPGAFGVATVLVPLAAVGLALMMVGAAITHLRRHEPQLVALNAVLLVLAVVVAWGRLGPYSFGS